MPRRVAPQDLPQSESGRCILLFSRHILSSIWAAGDARESCSRTNLKNIEAGVREYLLAPIRNHPSFVDRSVCQVEDDQEGPPLPRGQETMIEIKGIKLSLSKQR